MTVASAEANDVESRRKVEVEHAPVSGQSVRQKIQFGTGVVSPLACGVVLGWSKDIYVLEMGANTKLMGIASAVVAVWSAACFPIVGYLMDRDVLGSCFPWAKWGRRAPWFMIHVLIVTVATSLVYVPPSFDSDLLCVWFLLLACFQSFALSVLFTTFAATRVELYPTKEERGENEALVKICAGVGNTLGTVPQLIIAAGATVQARVTASVFYFLVGLISLLALPIFKLARQEYDASQVLTPLKELQSLLRLPAYIHFLAVRGVEAFAVGTLLSTIIYYLTVVEGLTGQKRSIYIFVLGITIAVATLAVMGPWTHFFRHRRHVNTNAVCGLCNGIGVFAPLVMFAADAVLPSPMGLFAYLILEQMTWTGQTFWRLVALGWLVDEDTLAVATRRREAVFSSGALLVSAVGSALATTLVINGLAASGLDMPNCELFCKGAAEPSCVEDCQTDSIARQPQAVHTYLRAMLWFLVPVAQLVTAVLTYTFPIKGQRLEAIYAGQAERYKPCAAAVGAVEVLDGEGDFRTARTPPSPVPSPRTRDVSVTKVVPRPSTASSRDAAAQQVRTSPKMKE